MVYVTGDLHGDVTRLAAPALRRLKKGDILLVCGDFGFVWEDTPAERRALRKIARKKYTVAFLDGAHENFQRLTALPEETWCGDTVRRVAPNIVWLTRGSIYTIEGRTFFTMGGGEKEGRGFDSPEETPFLPDEQELRRGLARLREQGNRVDYILTHEPSGKAGAYVIPSVRRCSGLDVYFDGIEQTVDYRQWYCGSIHADRRISGRHSAVYEDILPVETEQTK